MPLHMWSRDNATDCKSLPRVMVPSLSEIKKHLDKPLRWSYVEPRVRFDDTYESLPIWDTLGFCEWEWNSLHRKTASYFPVHRVENHRQDVAITEPFLLLQNYTVLLPLYKCWSIFQLCAKQHIHSCYF